MNEQYDEIFNAILNGQHKQSAEQMRHLRDKDAVVEMIDYFQELGHIDIALRAAKNYIRLA